MQASSPTPGPVPAASVPGHSGSSQTSQEGQCKGTQKAAGPELDLAGQEAETGEPHHPLPAPEASWKAALGLDGVFAWSGVCDPKQVLEMVSYSEGSRIKAEVRTHREEAPNLRGSVNSKDHREEEAAEEG